MKITSNVFEDVPFIPSPNTGGVIIPRFIVMHYTAGYTGESAINTLTKPVSKVSAHLVVDTDGKVTQLVRFNTKAFHAGPSFYDGYRNLNDHSIGIEIVNIGWLQRLSNGDYQDPYGKKVEKDNAEALNLVPFKNPKIGSGEYYQPAYKHNQLKVLDEVVAAILDAYPTIKDIIGHEDIDTRGWKTDPGPAFPMKRYKNLLSNRDDEPVEYTVDVQRLNVRGGPGVEYETLHWGPIIVGTRLQVIDRKGEWLFFKNGDRAGWVSSRYVKRS